MKQRVTNHPGVIFYEEMLKPRDITISDAALKLGVSVETVDAFVHQKTDLTVDLAVRISKATGTSTQMWMNLQINHTESKGTDHLSVEPFYKFENE